MRAEGPKHIVLSERNILSLLAKVRGAPGESKRTLIGDGFTVSVETDAEHYGNRSVPPGIMHPETEAALHAAYPAPA